MAISIMSYSSVHFIPVSIINQVMGGSAVFIGWFFLFTGAAPLSAPAFSLVFPLLKMVMIETPHNSEDKEEFLVKILQILMVHAQLRSSANGQSLLVDEVRAVGSDDLLQMTRGIKQELMCKLDKADECSKLELTV